MSMTPVGEPEDKRLAAVEILHTDHKIDYTLARRIVNDHWDGVSMNWDAGQIATYCLESYQAAKNFSSGIEPGEQL